MSLQSQRVSAALVTFVLIIGLRSTAVLAAPPLLLFTEAPAPPGHQDKSAPTWEEAATVRSRYVTIDFSQLDLHGPILLNLFEDVVLIASHKHTKRRARSDYTWYGYVLESEGSQVTLVVQGNDLAGNITFRDGTYRIRPAGGALHLIREVELSALPDEDPQFLFHLSLFLGTVSRDPLLNQMKARL